MKHKTDYIRRLGKKCRSKRGTTLVELIATVAILSIVATFSLQAIMIAHEENTRVNNISLSQRSISLMQENFNVYVKNAVEVELVKVTQPIGTVGTVQAAINNFINERTAATPPDNFRDFDTDPSDEYNDYILYRSGVFQYTLAKYNKATMSFQGIFTVDDIKEINFSFKVITGSLNGSKKDYALDYVISSPVGRESVFVKTNSDDVKSKWNTPWVYESEFQEAIVNNLTEGDYSVVTGTVLNNMYGDTSTASDLRISEGYTEAGGVGGGVSSNDGSYRNFVFIRILPKVGV